MGGADAPGPAPNAAGSASAAAGGQPAQQVPQPSGKKVRVLNLCYSGSHGRVLLPSRSD